MCRNTQCIVITLKNSLRFKCGIFKTKFVTIAGYGIINVILV